jgi:hypothetical protein
MTSLLRKERAKVQWTKTFTDGKKGRLNKRTKGQLISKCIFGVSNSPKKRT